MASEIKYNASSCVTAPLKKSEEVSSSQYTPFAARYILS